MVVEDEPLLHPRGHQCPHLGYKSVGRGLCLSAWIRNDECHSDPTILGFITRRTSVQMTTGMYAGINFSQ